jgi:3-oxoacyl-[acyl-carrier-protein] synthase II
MSRRVVVTGMGTINPLGHDVVETWKSALNGRSGVGPITLFDASDLLVQIGCEVKGFDPEQYMEARDVRRRDRFQQFASAAAQQALAQSGVAVQEGREERFGVIVSTAVGGLGTMQEGVQTMDARGPRRINPFLIPMFMPNGASGLIAIDIGAQGPCFSIASACATGADSIGQAALMIRSGVIDVCLAGGTEATITKIGVSSFDRLGALSRSNEDYSRTPAPFDKDRDGLVMGEGAAVLVLEGLDYARERGAAILAELVGYGSTEDAFHVTAPSEDGQGGAVAIGLALEDAGLRPQDVDYINAHGTATVLNDVAETKAIKLALGEAAYGIPVSSTKSMTGHLMGATGALEAIFCIQAIREGAIPPTIHFNEADPECDLDYVPNQPREVDITVALSNAFGFGGHNAVLAFKVFNG